MAIARPILGFVSLLVLAAGVLFQFFIILSGIVNVTPFNKTYFLQAAAGPRDPTRWTFWKICSEVDGVNGNCGAVVPALPLSPVENFGTTTGVPTGFIGTNHYFLLSRFMFAFFLIALFFAVIALFTGVLALCTRLGAYLSGLNTFIAMIFQALAAALMTACYVQGRNLFRANGTTSSIGPYAFGWMWASFFAYLLCTIFFCVGGSVGKKNRKNNDPGVKSKKGGFFGRRNKKTQERGSIFIDPAVKDEYDAAEA